MQIMSRERNGTSRKVIFFSKKVIKNQMVNYKFLVETFKAKQSLTLAIGKLKLERKKNVLIIQCYRLVVKVYDYYLNIDLLVINGNVQL
jgi:hypothetical protein